MADFFTRPQIADVTLNDDFWTPYIESLRNTTLPYCLRKFGETGYIRNFKNVASGIKKVNGNPFSDGLVLETITGACRFLNSNYDKDLDQKIDELIDIIASAQLDDGYLCTQTHTLYPERRWGRKGGDIVFQHDLYNHGTLIEAAVAHYKATGKTTLLLCGVKAANLICSQIGLPPKYNVIPGHSLPELAFIELYDLFKNTPELKEFAEEHNVNTNDYLEIVRFWYDNRGVYTGREMNDEQIKRGFEYNQDTIPFGNARKAMGHAVRAGLCYAGAASAYLHLKREDFKEALDSIWDDVTQKKLHISGGIGSRHDIEGFDSEYLLPNDAYLETCAGIAFALWAGEMNLIRKNSSYFDYFELSLYNNILGSIGNDFKNYYYDNALINDGTNNRWQWHVCPCCPPMLLKLYASLATYIYSYNDSEFCINMYVGSKVNTPDCSIVQKNNSFRITRHSHTGKLCFRIPEYSRNFKITKDGKEISYTSENGYACVYAEKGVSQFDISFENKLSEICANINVAADRGMVCIMWGKYLMCAEGADNNGEVEFTLAENATFEISENFIKAKTSDDKNIILIPYYQRNNRVSENPDDSKMAVWFKKDGMNDKIQNERISNNNLYGYYSICN